MSITVTVTPPSVVPAITNGANVQVVAAGGVGSTTIGASLRVSVANIDDPSTELAALGDATWPAGTIVIPTQDVAGANAYRIYVLDLASTDAASTPNRINRAAGGQWVLIGGKGIAGSYTVETTLAVGGAATVGGTLGVSGATTLAALTAAATTLASATITGAASVGTTLNVTGTTTAAAINASAKIQVSGAIAGDVAANFANTSSSGYGVRVAGGTGGQYLLSLNDYLSTEYVNVTTATFAVKQTTASSSTSTGALTVAGGVGISGALYVGTNSRIDTGAGNSALLDYRCSIRNFQTGCDNGVDASGDWFVYDLTSSAYRFVITSTGRTIIGTNVDDGANKLQVNGGVAAAGTIRRNGTLTTDVCFATFYTGCNTFPYFCAADGTMNWGSGTSAVDVTMTRNGVGLLQIAGGLSITTTLSVTGTTNTGAINASNTITVTKASFPGINITNSTSATTWSFNADTGQMALTEVSVADWLVILKTTGVTKVLSTVASSSTTTGALVVSGGAGVSKDSVFGQRVALGAGVTSLAYFVVGETGTSPLSGSAQQGVRSIVTGTSAATQSILSVVGGAATSAAAYTCGLAAGGYFFINGLGAGSTITRAAGAVIERSTVGTNMAGLCIIDAGNSPAWTGTYAIACESTQPCQFAGNLTVTNASPSTTLAATANGGVRAIFTAGSGTVTNWIIGHNYNFAGVLEFTPSTSVGGSVYSTPMLRLSTTAVNIASGATYQVNGTTVVSARDTGWTAMTGTPDKATAYATSTVTLAQLAGRVAQLQASLTAHGLIGA